MTLVAQDKQISVGWDNGSALVVSGPEGVHRQIDEFLKAARDKAPAESADGDKTGGKFQAFRLNHARASLVTLNLEEFFVQKVPRELGDARPKFVWDAATNTIVVQGATEEQLEDIGNLLKIYDQPPQSPAGEARLARLRDKIKQMRGLFEDTPGTSIISVDYKTDKMRREFSDHWQYLMAGLEERSDSKNFTFNWNRKQGGKEIEITAPIAAHKELFEPIFAGADLLEGSSAEHRLQPGDQVRIQVVGAFPEAPIHDVYTIEQAGTVALGPSYGRAAIAGLTLLEAEDELKAFLGSILTDVDVQITLVPSAGGADSRLGGVSAVIGAGGKNREYFYDGKTFEEWRSLWKQELKTERRIEAIEALSAFARAGLGKEATETILDVAGEYDFSKYWRADNSPDAKLREAVVNALGVGERPGLPAATWLPVLAERLAADPAKWQAVADALFSHVLQLDAATRELLLKFASDPKYGPNAVYLSALHRAGDAADPRVEQLIKEALTGEDGANAVKVLFYLGINGLETQPERLAPLFHEDAETRRAARTILTSGAGNDVDGVAERLLAVLDDPARSENHVEAIRALAAVMQSNRGFGGQQNIEKVIKKFESLLETGPREALPAVLWALNVTAENAEERLKRADLELSAERKSEVLRAADNAEEEGAQILEPQAEGLGGDGRGGGIF
jgi:hypothetical protein